MPLLYISHVHYVLVVKRLKTSPYTTNGMHSYYYSGKIMNVSRIIQKIEYSKPPPEGEYKEIIAVSIG